MNNTEKSNYEWRMNDDDDNSEYCQQATTYQSQLDFERKYSSISILSKNTNIVIVYY